MFPFFEYRTFSRNKIQQFYYKGKCLKNIWKKIIKSAEISIQNCLKSENNSFFEIPKFATIIKTLIEAIIRLKLQYTGGKYKIWRYNIVRTEKGKQDERKKATQNLGIY